MVLGLSKIKPNLAGVEGVKTTVKIYLQVDLADTWSAANTDWRMATDLASVKKVWRAADAVCFDVDSTVMKDEALDELAKFCGVGKEVQEWAVVSTTPLSFLKHNPV
ncbi:Phosphoserine phosphatase, chloroplastic [Mizuhopecten yessoensis]|uniref:Phosphoserine phosphatase n=1 Tax=Mizuhopecten yessoensis TaxID=6573 RepID=A0A210R6G7_MIZYE|nr:Phosphoserine phosphatase, chloroplastic [Mizuhopecten yessoensis]